MKRVPTECDYHKKLIQYGLSINCAAAVFRIRIVAEKAEKLHAELKVKMQFVNLPYYYGQRVRRDFREYFRENDPMNSFAFLMNLFRESR